MKIRTIDKITYLETILFQQYFAQITYGFDVQTFDDMKNKVFALLDENRKSQAILELNNFSQGLHVKEFGADAWLICYAILLDKKDLITEQRELVEYYKKNAKKATEKEVKETVVNFSKAFPVLWRDYQIRAEGLAGLENLLFKKS